MGGSRHPETADHSARLKTFGPEVLMEREKIGFDGIRCAWELLEERQPGPTGNGTLGQREGKLIRRVSVLTGSWEKMLSLGEGGPALGGWERLG